ncbi:MAG TPA: YggS family pyridoxal phosphate-dependent enzyme [Candidatus Kapabacteria bacterium]|nr:YggS family pyridoxal phosphate-dependent enzyme [Candidatus Kapabacteria bacterium]
MEDILHNIKVIEEKIVSVCNRIGRNRKEIKLLLATKTVTPERIIIAFESGENLIAENKVQELKAKYEALKKHPHNNHFIGHLQSNKIKDILRCDVQCIQTIDSLELAEKINQKLSSENKSIDILVQVNTSSEKSKFGVEPHKADELVQSISKLTNIKIKGLMTIGLFSSDLIKVRNCYKLLSELKYQIDKNQYDNVEMQELSMGMSGDFDIAIEEGATIIRVGTAIFGKRIYPDSYYWNESK